ncbi:MAG: FhaA domain-containing protein [Actinomycetota bacterium]|jgi:predicted component of type VI protein secretion system
MALRNIEQKIEGMVEKTFGRMFRSTLQPVELARRLAREMEDHKTVSVSRVYVPNQYTVYLSPADRRQFSSYESALVLELGSYLEAHARSEGLSLLSMPRIRLETDTDLRPGEFGIACRMVDPGRPGTEPEEAAPAAAAAAGAAMAPAADAAVPPAVDDVAPPEPAMPDEPAEPLPNEALAAVSGTQVLSPEQARAAGLVREHVTLYVAGQPFRISQKVTTMGRSRDCDIVVPDANVSRVHAEVRHEGLEYVLVDLGSTNGVEVNGRRVLRHNLRDGDRVSLGGAEVVVERR